MKIAQTTAPGRRETPVLRLVEATSPQSAPQMPDEWVLANEQHARVAARFDPATYPYSERMRRQSYERRLHELQIELLKLQRWVQTTGQRLVVLFEGRDAAGKGGTIKRFSEHLDPRGVRVVALEKPSEMQRGQWYFQRYVEKLPSFGQIVLFDRSWYNRAGVEHVMGFCTPQEYESFFPQANELERNLVGSGFTLFKLWFDVSKDEQRRRVAERAIDPLKQWKLSPIDFGSLEKWDAYTAAEAAIFARTSTDCAPWIRIKSDCKRRARIQALLCLLHAIDYAGKNIAAVDAPDSLIASRM